MKICRQNDNKGFFLYIDILGFSKFVEENDPQIILYTIKSALNYVKYWSKANRCFEVIYFSDSFIFYQSKPNYIDTAFMDIVGIAQYIFIFLLSNEIPVRGVISFGEFYVDISEKHNQKIYFGKALVEAHKAEKRENWIGITLEKSAYEQIPVNTISSFIEGSLIYSNKDHLLLNPFSHIISANWHEPEICEELINEIKCLKFVYKKVVEFKNKGDFTSRIASKYFNTLFFFENTINEYCFEQALKFDIKDH
ncbi:MAG: hypothetical protein KAU01_08745 [Candidatus Cloacimonetes bacterium]|nr:hypothetical protein [Candidatus Cloacimonadota bacterium]